MKRDTLDVTTTPSAFVNTDVDEDILMVLKGELAEMVIQIAPQVYQKYVTVDKKGTKILYKKAAEGVIQIDEGKSSVLQETAKRARSIWFHCEPIQSMCCQHDKQGWETTYRDLARG
jgi:hypothetical protein